MKCDFDELYYATYRSILRTVLIVLPTAEDAHDVVQEAFVRALTRWDRVGHLESPGGWVRRVALSVRPSSCTTCST